MSERDPIRSAADVVAAHLARHHAVARERGEADLAPVPDAAVVETIIGAGFWASLRREEGRSPKISLAFLPPDRAPRSLTLARRLPLSTEALVRLAPAVERPGIHLGVWPEGGVAGELSVWGATRTLPQLCFVLEVVEPGLLVAKHRRDGGFGKFANVAIVQGDRVKVVDEEDEGTPDCPSLVASLLRFVEPAVPDDDAAVLVRLALSMRAHGRGGSLLVVPRGKERWWDSVVQPMPYAVDPAYARIPELLRDGPESRQGGAWQDALRKAIDGIAGLTAVDGATVITDRYELLAFGAKIVRRKGSPPVEELVVTEPVVGAVPERLHPTQLGGTRHLSAAQFVQDQHDALALVASQDGRFTVFSWSEPDGRVRAHRVEILLL